LIEDIEERIEYEERRRIDSQRIKVKDKDEIETVEEVFDTLTLNSLYKLMRKIGLKKIYGVISSGKESRVYRAVDYRDNEYALKIYLTFTSEFKKGIWKYIYGDPRFESYNPTTTRKLILLWAKKEYKNLERMHRNGVSVPRPYGYQDNIIAMEFIGENGARAPLLKELRISSRRKAVEIYKEILENVRKMVCKARLVHADLSEYNIMVFKEKVYIIDVSQAVLTSHPNAQYFLEKDLENINRYFKKQYEIAEDTDKTEEIKSCLKI
jgi:RIO kinase 1